MPSAARDIGGGLRALGTCLLVAVFLAVSGCGGGDSEPDPFADGYNAAIRQLAGVNQEVAGLDVSARSSRAIAREFDRFAEALRSTRTELAGLEPPQRAAAEFDAL